MGTEQNLSPLAEKNLMLCVERIGVTAQDSVDLPRLCAILAAAGLRIVDVTAIEAKRNVMEALATIAAAAMSNPDTMQQLVWED